MTTILGLSSLLSACMITGGRGSVLEESVCANGWVMTTSNTCVKLMDSMATWHDSKRHCISLGGDLVTLNGIRKDMFIRGWLIAQGIKMVDDDQPTYGYKGCFRDRPDRVLRGFNKVTEFNDLEFCANTCYKKGYKYMGVENGEHCLCGNEENYGKHGLCSAVGCHCHKRCLRDNTQICGDGWAISVYNLREEQALWIGGHEAVNGIWKWDGLYKGFLTRNGWVQGEPSNRVGENCMAVSSSRLLWSDRVCSARFKYICEKIAA